MNEPSPTPPPDVSNGMELSRTANFIWSLLGIEILIVPALFAQGVFHDGGGEVAIGVVGITLVAGLLTSRGVGGDSGALAWFTAGGLIAQIVTVPFVVVRFAEASFLESFAPRLERSTSPWVLVGAVGAVVVGARLLHARDLFQAELIKVPPEYRRFVSLQGTSIGFSGVAEFVLAVILAFTLHPPLWNSTRFVVNAMFWTFLFIAAALAIPRKVKRLRDREFDAFWADFDLAKLSRAMFVPPPVENQLRPRRIRRDDTDRPWGGFTD